MKSIIVLLTLSLLAFSCGTEETAVEYAPQNNLVSNTALKEKVMRVAQNPTTIDNIIDGCDCFSIKMPYVVYVNGTELQINSTADLVQVETILNASNYDYDWVLPLYPMTVIYADYSEETFTTELYFIYAKQACTGTPELGCIDLEFPVGVKTYNSQNALAQSFEVGDKEALYGFLQSVDGYDAATLTYPLQITDANGTTVSIADNEALEQLIDTNTPVCEAQYYEPEAELVLAEVLDNGDWGIGYFFNEGDVTSAYSQYIFIFNPDNTMIVTGNFPASDGFWDTNSSSGQQMLNLYSFTDTYLADVEQSWVLTEITETEAYFYTPSDGVTPQKYLQLTKL